MMKFTHRHVCEQFASTNPAVRQMLATALSAAGALAALPVHSAPTDGIVITGAVTGAISQQGSTTTITQLATQPQQPARMIINWKSFSSAAGESIVFNQPNASAIALNRITGASPSELLGSLTANGQVFILNPNGVFFRSGSQVNVRGLLASTLDMDNGSFLSGTHVLQGTSSARVVNQGAIKAADGGYVALVGPAVVNDGLISATKGDALLAAGDKVTLRLEGGSLLGYSMDLGSVNALVDNSASGVINANGGRVALEARAADAVGKAVVNHAGLIEARTLESSKGSIRLIGDRDVGQANVSGTLDASAPNGGDGGFIETSAAHVKIADGTKVTTIATSGTTGRWLIDPVDFEVVSGSGEFTASSVGSNTLSANLLNTSVTIKTGLGNGQGDIKVNAPVVWQGGYQLTLEADRNIYFNALLQGENLALLYGQASKNGGTADFYFNNGAKIEIPVNSEFGNFFTTQKGFDPANLKRYTVISSLGNQSSNPTPGTLQGITRLSNTDNYALGTDVTATETSGWNAGAGFTPLGQLNGTFEGLGHKISDLTINRPGSSVIGLFSSIGSGAQVRNLGMTNATIVGAETVGALAGSNLGTISNVYVTGQVSGTLRTGGLVGINVGTVSTAYSEATVTGNFIAGGLVGGNEITGTINNSYASGPVSAIVSSSELGSGFAGGLVGYSIGTITGSYASGATKGTNAAGGLVGQNAGKVHDSYARGSVEGNSNVGGLAGLSTAGSEIKNSYATGAVKGTAGESTHGLVGASAAGVVSNSYWNTDTGANGGAGEGKTGTQLQQAATFSGWDIATTGGTDKVWRIYEGNSMPLLRSFLAPLVLDPLPNSKVYSGVTQQNDFIPTVGAKSGTAASGRKVGTYQPYSNQQGYDISNGELVITPKALDITAQIETRVYNGTDNAKATFTDTRFAGDDLKIASTSATFANKNVGTDKPVTVSGITLDGKDAGNYTFQNKLTSTGQITPFSLFFNVAGLDKVYDGTTDATVLVSAVKVGNEDVFTNRTASFDNKNAGAKQTVTITVTGLRGADAGNYTFTPPPTTTATIQPKPLVIIANPDSKVFDGTPYQGGNGVTYAGFVPGETETVLSGQLRYGGNAQGAVSVGNYRITPGGLSSANYASTFVDGALTVQPPLPDTSPPAPLPNVAPLTPLKPAFAEVEPVIATVFAGFAPHPQLPQPTPPAMTAPQLRVLDCGITLPENILLGACLP